MSKEYELEKVFDMVVGKAPANTNPRYDLYVKKEHAMAEAIIDEIQKYNSDFTELDYENIIFAKISDVMNEYALDAFAKGIEFERNLHNQSINHINREYDL